MLSPRRISKVPVLLPPPALIEVTSMLRNTPLVELVSVKSTDSVSPVVVLVTVTRKVSSAPADKFASLSFT